MTYVLDALKKKESELLELKALHPARRLSDTGETLHSVMIRGKYRYYVHFPAGKDRTETRKYLNRHATKKILRLAQKEYDQSFLHALQTQLEQIQAWIHEYEPNLLAQTYEQLHPGKKVLLSSYTPSYEEYRAQWESAVFSGNPYPYDEKEFFSERGDRLRSKSEVIIADRLFRSNLAYRCEAPVILPSGKALYPDFTILHPRTRQLCYWEHFGRMDDPTYLNQHFLRKLDEYGEVGIIPGKNLLCTFESSSHPLNIKSVQTLIDEFLS